jgi:hypothetical protein
MRLSKPRDSPGDCYNQAIVTEWSLGVADENEYNVSSQNVFRISDVKI